MERLDPHIYQEVKDLLLKSKRGDTQGEKVIPKNEAIYLLRQELQDDLYNVISKFKGFLSLNGLLEESEEVYGEVILDDAYPIWHGEEIL